MVPWRVGPASTARSQNGGLGLAVQHTIPGGSVFYFRIPGISLCPWIHSLRYPFEIASRESRVPYCWMGRDRSPHHCAVNPNVWFTMDNIALRHTSGSLWLVSQ